MNKPLHI